MTDKPDQNDRQLLEQALEALEWVVEQGGGPVCEHESGGSVCFCKENAAINTLRTAIEQMEKKEPVAYKPPAKWTDDEIKDGYRGIRWVTADGVYGRPTEEDVARYLGYTPPNVATPLAAQPAPVQEEIQRLTALVRAQQITIEKLEEQRQWQGLTDEEVLYMIKHNPYKSAVDLCEAVEAKLKEKNT